MQSMCDPMKAVHLVYDEEDLWNESILSETY